MIGMDNQLKSYEPPAYMRTSDKALTDLQNNLTASGKGSGRAAQQKMAGRGMSAGKGQQARGDRAQQTADIKGGLASGEAAMKDANVNSNIANAYDMGIKNSMQGQDGLLTGLQQNKMGMGYNQGNIAGGNDISNRSYFRDYQQKPDKNMILRYLMG